jgi:hypothetical protein
VIVDRPTFLRVGEAVQFAAGQRMSYRLLDACPTVPAAQAAVAEFDAAGRAVAGRTGPPVGGAAAGS